MWNLEAYIIYNQHPFKICYYPSWFFLSRHFFPHDIKGMKHCTILGVQVMSLTSRVFLLQIKLLLDPHRPYLVNVQYHPVVGKTFLYDEIWGFCCTRKSGEKVDPQLQRLPLPVLSSDWEWSLQRWEGFQISWFRIHLPYTWHIFKSATPWVSCSSCNYFPPSPPSS